MKQGIGSTFLLGFISIFLVTVFAFITAIMSYMKAFRVNSAISNAIENHEGYNRLAQEEINRSLHNVGYVITNNTNCANKKEGGTLITRNDNPYRFCIYEHGRNRKGYIKFGILTYMEVDVPVVGHFVALPIYTETEKIYEFRVK